LVEGIASDPVGNSKLIQSGVALRLPPHSKARSMRTILVSILKFYKAVISPWLPPSCRFVPTCSEYAREAIERHGALRGSGMAVWRLLRCQPFCAGGHDPVK
jgi:uncharacterized protein